MSDNTKIVLVKALDASMRIGITVVIAVSSWSVISIMNNSTRLVGIETTRFTSTDGLLMQNEIMHAIHEVHEDVAVNSSKLDHLAKDR